MKEELISETTIVEKVKEFLLNKEDGQWHEKTAKTSSLHGRGADIILTGGKRNSEKFIIECKGESSSNSVNKEIWLNGLGQLITRMTVARVITSGKCKGDINRAYKYGLGLYWKTAQVALRRIPHNIAQTLNLYIFSYNDNGNIKQWSPSDFGNKYCDEKF